MAWRTRGHRGDLLESLIDISNEYYRSNGIARVDKISTPIKVVEQNSSGQITLGYFDKRSTVDYIGLAQGIALCFDAKETWQNSFSLNNFHDHQLDYMNDFKSHGGVSFFLVYFKKFETFYLLPLERVEEQIKKAQAGGRKSISHDHCLEDAIPIGFLGNMIHYLPAINAYLDILEAKA